MQIECRERDHRVVDGRVECPDPECLVAALHGGAASPMARLPRERPDWILQSPSAWTADEVEALAVLGDAGLVPQIVQPDFGDAGSERAPWPQPARIIAAG